MWILIPLHFCFVLAQILKFTFTSQNHKNVYFCIGSQANNYHVLLQVEGEPVIREYDEEEIEHLEEIQKEIQANIGGAINEIYKKRKEESKRRRLNAKHIKMNPFSKD